MQFIEQYWPLLVLAFWFGHKWWSAQQLARMLPELRQKGAMFVDVRSEAEYVAANAPSTINMPLPELGSRLTELPKDRDIVLCCASGSRSGMAKLMLKGKGFQKVYNAGSWRNLL